MDYIWHENTDLYDILTCIKKKKSKEIKNQNFPLQFCPEEINKLKAKCKVNTK